MTINFNINNVTSSYVKTVMLRKFFQMVFVGNNRKTLNIYTTTVLGVCDENKPHGNNVRTRYVSTLNKFPEFCMKFGFVIAGNDDNDVVSIASENVTSEDRGFLAQVDCIKQVWGNECQVLYNNQTLLNEKYSKFMDSVEGESPDSAALASIAKNKILWIEDKNKSSEPEMCSIAIEGAFNADNYTLNAEMGNPFNDGSEQAFYRISVPQNQGICEGIELLNWVKTTIRFRYYLNDQNLNFSIKKDADTRFISPDFTWYFSPPIKSFISYESSSAEVGWRKVIDSEKCPLHETCKCPIKPESKEQAASQRYDNIINPVANKTTVNFHRWVKDEMISYRQKYRITTKNIFTRPEDFNNIKELNIFIDTTDEHGRGNRQYVLGIFISFALAFGIDKTRLSDAHKYFPLEKLFMADTWWLFMIIAITLNLLIRPVRVIRKRRVIVWRMVNIIASLGWIFMVFCVDRSQWITNWFNETVGVPFTQVVKDVVNLKINYFIVPQAIFLILFLSNALYVVWNIYKYHDTVLSSLFGEDIL